MRIKEDTLFDVAELYKAFSDSTRIRILYCLYDEEKNVSTISDELQMSQSAISHQLRILKNYKLVKTRRQGKEIYYSLDDNHIFNIIDQGIKHIEEK